MPAAAAQAVPAIPFTQAAHEHVEPFAQSFTVAVGAAAQVLETTIPSYGYLRHVYVEVTGSGGATCTINANTALLFPFDLFAAITLLDTNGAPIYGPLDGYETYWVNAVGGYAFQNNLKGVQWFSGSATAPVWSFRIPVEIQQSTGVGALANQNAAAAYKVRLTVNPATPFVYSAATTPPTLSIKLALEAWSLPNDVDALGRPQAQVPPNHGTIQYWSAIKPAVASGNNYVQCTRVGNLIRNLIAMGYNATPALADNVMPNPIILAWDARQLLNETQNYRKQVAYERLLGFTGAAGAASSIEPGVFPYSFCHVPDNHSGDDTPTLWLPTVQATRLEIDGTNGAAGQLEVLTNDVAPVALDQSQRYVETGGTGFHPNPDTTPVAR